MKRGIHLLFQLLFLSFLLLSGKSSLAVTRTWIGSSTNTNWNVAGNWSGGVLPGSGDDVVFNSLSLYNCTINATVNVLSIQLQSGFTQTITQGNFAVTVGANGFTISSGTFTQSATTSGNTTINGPFSQTGGTYIGSTTASVTTTCNSSFSLSGGTYTSSSGTVTVLGNFSITGSPAFTHNGTFQFRNTNTITSSVDLKNVVFNPSTAPVHTISGIINVTNTLTLGGTTAPIILNGGEIHAKGAISLTNQSTTGGGSTILTINGTANQTITNGRPLGECRLPSVVINKTAGTLTIPTNLTVAGNWSYIAGTVTIPTASVIMFTGSAPSITPGSLAYRSITFSPNAASIVTFTGNITVNANLSLAGASSITLNGSQINLKGNAILTNTATGGGGTTLIAFNGTAAQAITSTLPLGQCSLPSVQINKTNTLTLPQNLSIGGYLSYVAGTVTVPSGSTVSFTGTSKTIATGTTTSLAFENLQISGTISLQSSIVINGSLTIDNGKSLNASASNYQISIKGNWTNNGTFLPNTNLVIFNGSAAQSVNNGTSNFYNIQISGTGVEMAGANTLVGNNVVIDASKTLAVTGSNQLTVSGNWTNNGTFTPNTSLVVLNGVAPQINNGTSSFHHFQISGSAGTATLISNLSANGNLTIGANKTLNTTTSNRQVNVGGNWVNNGTFMPNQSLVIFNGTSGQTITRAAGETFYNLRINNAAGVSLNNPVTVLNNLDLLSGNLFTRNGVNVYPLYIEDGATVTSASANSFVSGPIRKEGNASFVFPIGKGAEYRPLTVAGANSGDVLQGEYFNTIHPNASAVDKALDGINSCNYFDLQKISGTATSVDATINWNTNLCGAEDISLYRLARFDGTKWVMAGNSVHSGTIESGSLTGTLTNFGNIAIGFAAHLVVNTQNVNSNTFVVTAHNVPAGTFQSGPTGNGNGKAYVIPDIPTSGTYEAEIHIIPSDNNEDLFIKVDYNNLTQITNPRVRISGVYYPFSSDYYKIDGNEIIFYTEKPSKPSIPVTTNLENGIVYNRSGGNFTVTVAQTFNSSVLRIYALGSITPLTTISTLPLSWNGASAAPGIYKFELDLVDNTSTKTYYGQMIVK